MTIINYFLSATEDIANAAGATGAGSNARSGIFAYLSSVLIRLYKA